MGHCLNGLQKTVQDWELDGAHTKSFWKRMRSLKPELNALLDPVLRSER